jgi:hypothetical protein
MMRQFDVVIERDEEGTYVDSVHFEGHKYGKSGGRFEIVH